MNFVKAAALFALLLVALLVPVSTPSVSAHLERCPEHHTDYSQFCDSRSTRCGSFCFYAVCHECTPWRHRHSCGEGCSYYHTGHRSPCTLWHWNIYGGLPDPGPGNHRTDEREDEYDAPHLNQSLEFGMLRDDYVPPTSPCVVEKGNTSRGVTQLLPGEGLRPGTPLSTPGVLASTPPPGRERSWKSGNKNYHIMSLVDSHSSEISVGDLSHLPRTPGEPDPVTLDSVTKVTDNSVTLQVSGENGGVVQYRYWSYYGLQEPSDDGLELLEVAPSEFRVPFQDLGGETIIDIDEELQGIFSFQVRSLDAEGGSLGNSNILHEMIGMADFQAIRSPLRGTLVFSPPLPTPPVWGTPMPPLDDGGTSRPVRPSIAEVRQVRGVVRTVEVVLAEDYSDVVEYRWWPHSGLLPTPAFDEWLPASVSGRKFVIPGVEPKIPGDAPYTPVFGDIPDVSAFDFQVRLVHADGVPGDPSDVKALLVWGGDYIGWTTSQPMIPLQLSQPPVPPPAGFFCNVPEGTVPSGQGLLSDCQILLELADQAFGTPRLNWTEDIRVEDWTGVQIVGSPGRVYGVVLNGAGLTGSIPWSFGKLSSLRTLDLRGNELLGNIPLSLTSLHELRKLDLRDNQLVGSLPDLTTLSRLQHLRLDRNDLTGVLTDRLDGLNMLTSVGLSDNSFYGVIPPELAGYGLNFIRLGGNRFSGCIPPGLRDVPDNDVNSLVGPVDC